MAVENKINRPKMGTAYVTPQVTKLWFDLIIVFVQFLLSQKWDLKPVIQELLVQH